MSRLRTLSRRSLILTALAAPALARAAPCGPATVLFVCPAGTVKSAIAREMLRRRAAEDGLDLRVTSRGIAPEDHVSPALAARLRADGLDLTRDPVRPLSPADVERANVVIAFDAAADSPLLHDARVWRTPSWNDDYDAARADLVRRLDALVADLRGRSNLHGQTAAAC